MKPIDLAQAIMVARAVDDPAAPPRGDAAAMARFLAARFPAARPATRAAAVRLVWRHDRTTAADPRAVDRRSWLVELALTRAQGESDPASDLEAFVRARWRADLAPPTPTAVAAVVAAVARLLAAAAEDAAAGDSG